MKRALILFTKVPRDGFSKTRLGRDIGDDMARRLQEAFIGDLVFNLLYGSLKSGMSFDISFHITPYSDENVERMKSIVSEGLERYMGRGIDDSLISFAGSAQFVEQVGSELGSRMRNAVAWELERGATDVLLMGSDIPDVPYSVIKEGFRMLAASDMVIAPTEDGGYYLVGMKKDWSSPFSIESYGSSSVFDETVRRSTGDGMRVAGLQTWCDVDTVDDLMGLRGRIESEDDWYSFMNTAELLRKGEMAGGDGGDQVA